METGSEATTVLERIRDLEAQLAHERGRLRPQLEGERHGLRIHALEVTVAGEAYLVPTATIREVVRMAAPEPVTDAPEWVVGVVPFGSASVPVVDLGRRLETRPTEVAPELFLVITETPTWLGLMVDEVGRVLSLDAETITDPAGDVPCAPFLLGVQRDDDGLARRLLSVDRLGRELDG